MKNIHVLPTDKPSRLLKTIPKGNLILSKSITSGSHWENQHIYITSDDEIKTDNWYLDDTNSVRQAITECESYWTHRKKYQKIILTTDTNLIKDGVQAIDDEFLEWFVKNPNCEKIEIKTRYLHSYKTGENFISFSKTPEFSSRNMQCMKIEPRYEIIIPQEESKQMSKLTAVEWLVEKLILDELIDVKNGHEFLHLQSKAKEMEKQQSQNYAIFAIRCDRTEMRILDFNDYIKLVKNEEK
jgi:hypothetical protein